MVLAHPDPFIVLSFFFICRDRDRDRDWLYGSDWLCGAIVEKTNE